MSAQTPAAWRSDRHFFLRFGHRSSSSENSDSSPPSAMRLRSPLKSPLKSSSSPQSLVEAFVRSCSCRDSDCSYCSCTLASTLCFAARSPLAELRTDPNVSDFEASPKLKLVKGQSRKPRSSSVSPSPRKSGGFLCRSKSGKRSFGENLWESSEVAENQVGEGSSGGVLVVSPFKRKRPPRLQIPAEGTCSSAPRSVNRGDVPLEVSAEGKCFGMYSRKGHRDVLEDAFQALPEIESSCRTRQAFFGIFDGHGGRTAAEFAADNLCRNIREALNCGEDHEAAVRAGYLTTDAGFLQKQASGGASCVTALVENELLVVANAGDCRAVLSKNGLAIALTQDHRLGREDERRRVEELGAYVDCFSGVWRLQGVLAVSRGIGDGHLKEWVSAEPETHKLSIDPDCEFLILASDGLWDAVSNQEAVDCIRPEFIGRSAGGGLASSSKKLAQLAASRGSQDDISVMVVSLKYFLSGTGVE